MRSSAARPLRSALILLALSATLTLVACASVAAQGLASAPGTATPPPITVGPGNSDPGTGVPGTQPGQSGSGQPGDPGDPNQPIGSSPLPYLPIIGDGADHVVPVPGVKDAQPAGIDHVSVAPDGVTLTVYWYGGVDSCYALSSVTAVRGTDGVLVITVMEGTRPDLAPNTMCPDLAQLKATTITIDQPLYRDGSQEPVAEPSPTY